MKKSILMLMVASLFTAMPILAAEQVMKSTNEQMQCCVTQSEAIGEKIKRLQDEIKMGKNTYSAEELRKLEAKLKEANDMMDMLIRPAAAD